MLAQSLRSLSLGVALISLVSVLMLWRDLGNTAEAKAARREAETRAREAARAKMVATTDKPKTGTTSEAAARTPDTGQSAPDANSPTAGKVWRIAILQHGSMQVLDEIAEGMINELTANGFVLPEMKNTLIQKGYAESPRATVRRLNAQMDASIGQALASQIMSGDYDLVLTISTLSLQSMANANKGGVIHVFAGVADPWSALPVQLKRGQPLSHPPYLVGLGSMQPVANGLRVAKQMRPELKKIGVPYNNGEANSRAQITIARTVCKELGLELIEAPVDNPAGVQDGVLALISQGAEVLMIPGDITMMTAADFILKSAQQAGVPVFTLIPPTAKRGALFDLGADYVKIGELAGAMAVEVMNGRDPATIPIENVMPEQLMVNQKTLLGLRQPWSIPEDLLSRATVVIDADGKIVRDNSRAKPQPPKLPAPAATSTTPSPAPAAATPLGKPEEGRTYKLGFVYFGPEPGVENCMRGLIDGLKQQGFEEGRNLKVTRMHAAGEISNIPAIIQQMDGSDIDVLVPMSTPCVTAACKHARQKPVVFTYCYDPIAAGVGKSFTDKLPNVTGVGSFPPLQKTLDVMRQLIPDLKTVGTIYNTSEANSSKAVQVGRDLMKEQGITLVEIPAINTSEVYPSAQALAGKRPQAVWITGDNTVQQALPSLMRAMKEARIPVVINDIESLKQGTVAAVGLGWYESGTAGSKPLARVLLGEKPADIPIENVSRSIVQFNLPVAEELGITIPEALLKEATPVEAEPPASK
ncbi:MAG: ABC transporter substrate-binding protein [Candidatus Methylacidiphilales bacterium]|nr:ABC transporter substrate-binding protein [Candidatus Methylacidiphilales bacterium]